MSETQKHTKPNVPNLRFPGFEGEWERKRIGEIGSFFSGGTPSSSRKGYYGGDIPFIRSGEIHSDKTQLFLTHEGYNSSSAKMVEIGDILLALYGANSGDIAISQMRGAINQAILCIRTDISPVFLKSVWEKHAHKVLNTYLQGGQGNLSAEIVKSIPVFLPTQSEQDKIACFLDMIDKRIAIQIKVIEDCISLGQEVVNHAFSNLHTATVKLTDICNRITERNTKQISNNVLTISAKEGLVSQTDYFNKSVASDNLSNYYLLQQGDFAYNKSYSSDYPWGAIKHLERFHDGVLSPLYFCFRPLNELVDTNYLQLYFDTALWYKHISEIAVEGARNHGLLNMAVVDFYRMPIPLPPLNEQKNIARQLIVFKQKLETEQAILRAYQSQKQYLLNQLFV